jgi:hypothetical protein
VPDRTAAVEAVLRGEASCADDRHADLAEVLGLPAASVSEGYRYIAIGETPDGIAPEALRRTGGAPAPGTAVEQAPQLPPQPVVRARPPLVELVGEAPRPLGDLFLLVVQYIHAHTGFEADGVTFRCDDRLAAIFGADRFRMTEVAQRLIDLVDPA